MNHKNLVNPDSHTFLISSILIESAKVTDDELFFFIGQKLRQLLKLSWSMIFSVNTSKQTCKLEAVSREGFVSNLNLHLKSDVISHLISDSMFQGFIEKSITPMNISDIELENNISATFLEFDKEFQISQIFGVPFFKNDQLLGFGIVQLESIHHIDKDSLNVFCALSAEILSSYYSRKNLSEIENKFGSIVQKTNDAIIFVDENLDIIFWNNAAEIMFGYNQDEILMKQLLTILAKKENVVDSKRAEEIKFIPNKKIELSGIKKNSAQFPVELLFCLSDSGKSEYATVFIRDLTENKLAEDRFKAAINEKVTLLQEIHHRVKNNLQTISSLLYLQAKYFKDDHSREIFKSCRNRVRAMSLIYEKLYRSADFITIYYFKDYLDDLIKEISHSYKVDHHKVKFNVQVDNFALIADLAVPFGLILNELISNTLKYAFPKNWEGVGAAKIELKKTDDGFVRLNYHDNGIGFPKNFDFENVTSLGLKLVKNLVENQLEGTVHTSDENGAGFYIIFKG